MSKGKKLIDPKVTRSLKESQKNRCFWCLTEFRPNEIVHADHVVPEKFNGRFLVASCSRCNCYKGIRSWVSFVLWRWIKLAELLKTGQDELAWNLCSSYDNMFREFSLLYGWWIAGTTEDNYNLFTPKDRIEIKTMNIQVKKNKLSLLDVNQMIIDKYIEDQVKKFRESGKTSGTIIEMTLDPIRNLTKDQIEFREKYRDVLSVATPESLKSKYPDFYELFLNFYPKPDEKLSNLPLFRLTQD